RALKILPSERVRTVAIACRTTIYRRPRKKHATRRRAALAELFGGGRGLALECGARRVPRERRALDAHRELTDAREDRELAESLGVGLHVGRTGEHVVEAREERLGVLERLPLEGVGHDR